MNTYTARDQGAYLDRSHDVCTHADGSFVVVWESRGFQLAEDDPPGVFGQRYDAAGTRLGTEFQVNSYTTGFQYRPDVACLDDGGFVVAWWGLGADGYGVHGRRFDAGGAAATGELPVDSGETGEAPSVAGQPGAGFVIAYRNSFPGYEIRAQRFASGGAPLDGSLLVHGDPSRRLVAPRVDTDPVGNFVVVWEERYADNRVFARRYDASGGALGTEFLADEYTTGDWPEKPDVSVGSDGGFVVVWTSNSGPLGVGARRFDSAGAPLGPRFQVNTPAPGGHQFYGASVDQDAAGNFVVSWTDFDDNGYGVFGRRFDSAGAATGTEFQTNTYSFDNQMYGRVAVAPSGDFVVAWVSRYQDGDRYGIFARRWVGCRTLAPLRTTLGWKGAGADRFRAKADLVSSGPVDPATADTLELLLTDGTDTPIWQSGPIAPGPLWARSKPALHRFRWKDATAAVVPGLTAIQLNERPFGSGRYRLVVRGKNASLLVPPPTSGTHRLSVRFSSGACFQGAAATCSKRSTSERCS